MTASEYLTYFDDILNGKIEIDPYTNSDYIHYTRLNQSRQQRWLKKGTLSLTMLEALSSIKQPLQWILVTEPWCGDAAHSVPFILLMAEKSDLIDIQIVLRDSDDSCIDQYLTNGAKSIPKLIVRDLQGKDLFSWGPRPVTCQEVYDSIKKAGADLETLKLSLQKWYNEDMGHSLQSEISQLLLQGE